MKMLSSECDVDFKCGIGGFNDITDRINGQDIVLIYFILRGNCIAIVFC